MTFNSRVSILTGVGAEKPRSVAFASFRRVNPPAQAPSKLRTGSHTVQSWEVYTMASWELWGAVQASKAWSVPLKEV